MKTSAGILLYKPGKNGPEVFLVHPGGPYWQHKDAGAWSVPKGEAEEHEDLLEVAKREFREETGVLLQGSFYALGSIRQKSGKTVHVWAIKGDIDPRQVKSNTCTVEWPYKSGKHITIPEVDRGEWFALPVARQKINAGQVPVLDALETYLRQG